MKKFIQKVLSVALAITLAFAPSLSAYAASLSTDAASINNKISVSAYQKQITRYKTNGSRAAGQCNICAITNLLNRRLVFDGNSLSNGKFKFEYVFYNSCMYLSSNGLTVDKCKTNLADNPFDNSSGKIISNSDSDGYLYNPIYQLGTKKYKLTKYTGSYTAANIASLLDSHHEGIFIRCKYDGSGHCVVLYDYTKDSNGNYTFYSIDTATSDTSTWQGKFSNSYLGKKTYNGKTVSPSYQACVDVVMYLESTSSAAKMSQETLLGGTAPVNPTVNINVPSIGNLPKGKSFNLTGTVSASSAITSLKGEIIKGGSVVQSKSYSPNTTSVDIKSSTINTNLKFASLAAGSYTLRYTAVAGGKTYTKSLSFNICEPSINMTAAPTTINKGSAFNLAGTVSSLAKITKVVGEIKSGSTVKQTQTITPNTTSVDIKSSKINANLKFGTLAKGSYTLVITATDATGTSKTYTKSFTVN